MRRLLTVANEKDEKLLRREVRRVKNVQDTDVILGIQQMKQIAREWEHRTGNRCEGLAAAQIGWNARVIILRKSDWMSPPKPDEKDFVAQMSDGVESKFDRAGYEEAVKFYKEWQYKYGSTYDPWFVLVNLQILHTEGEQESLESCLSVPYGAYNVKRPTQVVFKHLLPNGKTSGVHLAKGESAIKLMHEQDHNLGILVSDSGLPLVGQTAEVL